MVETDRPTPAADIAQYILDGLDRQDAESLREIADHAEDLADWKEAQAAAEMEEEGEAREEAEDLPDDVPAKAGVVTKTINENQYHYYQWREGDQVKSQYKGPANSGE